MARSATWFGIFLFVLFGSFSEAFASGFSGEEQTYLRKILGQDEIVTVRTEDGNVVLQGFQMATDGWQDPVWREAYPTEMQASARLKQIGARWFANRTQLLELPRVATSTVAENPLWKVTQAWSWEWEQKYADWVTENADPQFFVKYGIATDCADVAFSLRWIFARIHGLPAAVRLAGTGAMVTQDTIRNDWLKYPQNETWFLDRRFLKAIDYVMSNTYTHTLEPDSYPIAITQQTLLPGTHYLMISGRSGHTLFVHRTYHGQNSHLPIRMMASTVPRSVRSLYEQDFWMSDQPVRKMGGFLRFRWPVRAENGTTTIVSRERMSFYSLEQYEPAIMNGETSFAMALLKRLDPGFSPTTWIRAAIKDLGDQIDSRKKVVEDGFAICSVKSCAPGTAEYEDWSTPSRDGRLTEMFKQVSTTIMASDFSDAAVIWEEALNAEIVELEGIKYSLSQLGWVFVEGLASYDPSHEPGLRWALAPKALAQSIAIKTEAALLDRENRIRDAKCTPETCVFGSPKWILNSTLIPDRRILHLRLNGNQFCFNFGEKLCAEYRSASTKQMVAGNSKTQSLSAWLEEAIWYNSNPLVSNSERWGAERLKHKSFIFPAGSVVNVAENAWALVQNDSVRLASLRNLVSGEVIEAPAGMSWSYLEMSGKTAVASAYDEYNRVTAISMMSFDDRRFQTIKMNESLLPQFYGQRYLILYGESEVLLFDTLKPEQVPFRYAGTETVADAAEGYILLRWSNGDRNDARMIDIETGKSFDIPKSIMARGFQSLVVQGKTVDSLHVLAYDSVENLTYILDKTTGAIVSTSSTGQNRIFFSKSSIWIDLSIGEFVTHDSKFNRLATIKAEIVQGYDSVCIMGEVKCYRKIGSALVLDSSAKKANVIGYYLDYVATTAGADQQKLSRISSPNEAILTATGFGMISENAAYIAAMNYYDQGAILGIFRQEAGQLRNILVSDSYYFWNFEPNSTRVGALLTLNTGERLWLD